MPKEYMHLGEVPDSVFQQQLFDYLQRKEDNPDAKRVSAQFEYNGKKYTFQRARSSSGFQIKRSSERVAKEAKRRVAEGKQTVKLSSAEQMMVDNIYDEASKRNLDVDHVYPVSKGGPTNAPWNLKLMQPDLNSAKGAQVGGNWQYEPLIQEVRQLINKINKPVSRFGQVLTELKDISQQAVDVKAQRMMDPEKRMAPDPKLMGPGGLGRQAVKEIAEELIFTGGQTLVNQVTGSIAPKPRSKKR